MRRWLVASVFLMAVSAAVLVWRGVIPVPDRWNPWAPLRLAEPPNLLTGFKLGRLERDPVACRAVLSDSDFQFRPVPDRALDQGCMFQNVVQVSKSDIAYSSGFAATCHLAVALALFERHTLQPAAQAVFDQPVVAIDHYGTYACRNVDNAEGGRRSQHAAANAIDIAGFRLRDGRRITVRRDWAESGDRGQFLEMVRSGACRVFEAVLSPENNKAHHDHFHFDMGRYSICR